jgi:hypothetical protein
LGKTHRLAQPQYLEGLIHEKLSKVKMSFRDREWKGREWLQGQENERFINAIKQLDKHTLNMYTLPRAELGTRELSWIRLDFRELRANGQGKGFRRNGSNEQDYWN